MQRLPLLTVLMAGLMAGGTTALAQGQSSTDWKQGAWGHLAPTIGTYDYDLVLKDAAVDAKLTAMLGEKVKAQLLSNLDVHDSIGFDRDCLVMSGNAEKSGGFDMAYLNVCLYSGKINAAILSDGKVTVYSEGKDYEYLPITLQQWVYGVLNQKALSKKPDGAQLLPKAP